MMILPTCRESAAARGMSITRELRVAGECYPFRIITTSEANPLDGPRGGWIEIIAGGMFSGKSEELIRRLRRALLARQRVQVFKPVLDDRFSSEDIVSRDDRRLKAIPIASSADLLARVEIGAQVVGIDEV